MRHVTIADARNIASPDFGEYVMRFVKIERDLHSTIASFGVPLDEDRDRVRRADELRRELLSLGARARNDGKSIVAGALSPACERCRTGERSVSCFLSLACPHNCWFCFNENQHDWEHYRASRKDWQRELNAYAKAMGKLDFVALTGGEPLLYPEETQRFFRHAKELNPRAHCRLYTSGWNIDADGFASLAESGLDEIRFSIKLDDAALGQRAGKSACGDGAKTAPGAPTLDEQLALIESAVGAIGSVMVEMPVVPGTKDDMRRIIAELDRMGAFGINLLELCFPLHRADEYARRGLSLVPNPYRVPYQYGYAGALPVSGSEELAYELMIEALRNNVRLGLHYCSLENKNTAQIFEQNHGGARDIPPYRFSQRDFFYKVIRAFEGSAQACARALDEMGAPYEADEDCAMVAFSPEHLPALDAAANAAGSQSELSRAVLFAASATIEPTDDGRERFREVGLHVLDRKDWGQTL